MSLNLDPGYLSFGAYREAIRRSVPNTTKIFFESLKQGFEYSSVVQASEWWEYKRAGFEENAYASKEDYEKSPEFDKRVEYEDNITPTQIEIITRHKNREEEFSWWMRNVKPFSIAPLIALAGASVLEPLAWFSVIPAASYALKVGSYTKSIGYTSILKDIVKVSAAGAALETGWQVIHAKKQEAMQEEPDVMMTLTDIAFGTVMTGSVFTGQHIYRKLKDAGIRKRSEALSKALSDLDEDVSSVNVSEIFDEGDLKQSVDSTQTDRTTVPFGPVERIVDGMKKMFTRSKNLAKEEINIMKTDETLQQVAGGVRTNMEKLVRFATNCVRRHGPS